MQNKAAIQEIICSLEQIQQIEKQSNNLSSYLLPQRILPLFQKLFYSHHGVIPVPAKIYQFAVQHTQDKWKKQMQKMIQILHPEGNIIQLMITHRDLAVNIEPLILPQQIQMKLSKNERVKQINVKKERNRVTMPLLDYFYFCWANSIINLKQIDQGYSSIEAYKQDDFHFHIMRNPYLSMFYLSLVYFKQKPVLNRIISIFSYVLIGHVTQNKMSQYRKQKSINMSQIHAIYILIRHQPQSIYLDYICIALNKFNYLSKSSPQLLRLLLRLYIEYYIFSSQSVQFQELFSIQNNSRYKLNRYSYQQYKSQINKIEPLNIEEKNQLQKAYQLVQKYVQSYYWRPNGQFAHTIFIYTMMISHLLNKDKPNILVSSIPKIVNIFKNDEKFAEARLEITEFYSECTDREIQLEDNQKSELTNKNSRIALKSYQSRISNPWQHPLKSSESYLLFLFWRYISNILSKYKPSTINLRPLSQIWLFLLVLLGFWLGYQLISQ